MIKFLTLFFSVKFNSLIDLEIELSSVVATHDKNPLEGLAVVLNERGPRCTIGKDEVLQAGELFSDEPALDPSLDACSSLT